MVRKFAQGVIDFYLEVLLVRFVDKCAHLTDPQKGIIYVRIKLIAMMEVDHIRTRAGRSVHRLVLVKITRAPMLFEVEGFERREQQIKIKMKFLSRFQF